MPMEKTFDSATAEPRITALWEAADAFRAGANAKPGAEPFSIMIPPPNVTGSLHIGHAFNHTLQDILIRWHRMRGFDTLWQVGTDHAGIATQLVTEREMAANGEGRRQDMTREAFVARVWRQKATSRGTIIGQLKRLGASCDWSREAFTMSGAPGAPAGEEGNFHDAVIKVFVDLYDKGLIYRGKRLVNWDPHFETAISDLEVENLEVAGHMWHFKYLLAGGETYTYEERDAEGRVTLSEERNWIAIATTRPETMLGDGAVAVHPSDTRYAGIVDRMVHLPLCDRLIPIIADEYPDPTFGSGAVKITGAHDFNDYAVAKRAGIPCYRLMDTRAQMRSDGAPYEAAAARAREIAAGAEASEAEVDALNLVPEKYRGLDRFEARRAVVADIEALGLSVMTAQSVTDPATGDITITALPLIEAKPIMQPFGDRSKVVIEPMLTDQWFVDTAKIVEPALEAVRSGATKIIPESGEKTYFHWLENIEPWCISRQLWWGHQIPVWYGPQISETGAYRTGTLVRFCAPSDAEVIAKAKAAYELILGPSVQIILQNNEPLVGMRDGSTSFQGLANDAISRVLDDASASRHGIPHITLRRDPDVLDTWFSSGLWPIGTLGWPEQTPELAKYFPTSTLVTGSDILFFWVARMMMMQLAVVGRVPFDTVYLHGLVRDAKGKKMSKSLGNVIDPLAIIDEYGADALRFANAAMATLGGTLKLDTQRIAGYRNFGTKLWNAARFAEMNGVWEGHRTGPVPTAQATVNRWIIGEAVRARLAVDASLDAYRFDQAAATIHAFVRGQVCDWYVEFAKPLFDGPQAAETRATMAWVLDQCMILSHPFMPFVTEELWQTTGTRDGLLCHAAWPDAGADLIDAEASREMTWVLGLIDDIRSARTQMNVPPGSVLPILALSLDRQAEAAFMANAGLIGRLARVGDLTHADTAPRGALTVPADGAVFAIPLGGVIDVAAEQARLGKALDKLGREIAGMDARLSNPAFAASAPEEVVTETRETRETRAAEADKLRSALARLAEMA